MGNTPLLLDGFNIMGIQIHDIEFSHIVTRMVNLTPSRVPLTIATESHAPVGWSSYSGEFMLKIAALLKAMGKDANISIRTQADYPIIAVLRNEDRQPVLTVILAPRVGDVDTNNDLGPNGFNFATEPSNAATEAPNPAIMLDPNRYGA
jgi:hypothetical protein